MKLIYILVAIGVCVARDPRCALPIDSGICYAAKPKYAFDSLANQCVAFTYGGCMGNDNRFDSMADCQAMC